MKTNLFRRILCIVGVSQMIGGLALRAAPLTWFPGPALDAPMSGSGAVYNGGQNILTGGDADQSYFFPVSYPISLAATNLYWSYLGSYDGLNIAPGVVVFDGNLVIYGGTDGTNAQNITLAFNLTGDTPPSMPAMNVARAYLGYAPDRSGNAYAFGGLDDTGNPLSSVECLSLANNSPAWTYVASLPGPLYNFPAVFNRTNYIYIFGGLTDPATGTESDSVLRYSVSGNSWTAMASLPVAVAGSAAALGPDGQIYVVGGTAGGVSTNLVQVYNPASDSWSIATPLPEGLSLAALGVDSLGRLIVMGGVDTNGLDVADVWRSQPFGVPDSAPVITNFPATNATYLASYSSSIKASGTPQPVYQLLNGPAGLTVDYYSGAISWTPQGLGQIGASSVTIAATNYAGVTNYTFAVNVPNPPPAPPTNLTLVSVTEDSVTLAWSPEDPTVGQVTYSVWLRHVIHDPKGSGATIWYTQIGSSTTGTNLTISGLAANTAQSYYVEATGPGGTSGYSAVAATTLPAPAPANLRMTSLTATNIGLEWDAPVGQFPIVSYEVLGWYNGIAAQYPLAVPNLLTTSVIITNLAPGDYMLWGVSARDSAGNVSAYTYLPYLVLNAAQQPPMLTPVSASPGPGGFQFTVRGSSIRTNYIQATTNLGDPASWITIATNPPTGAAFIFTDTNAPQMPNRYYRVVTQ